MAKTQVAELSTWIDLNMALVACDESTAQALLQQELKGKQRRQFVLRIHSRYNRLRAARERQELLAKIK